MSQVIADQPHAETARKPQPAPGRVGDKLLTTANPAYGEDMSLLAKAGVRALEPFAAH